MRDQIDMSTLNCALSSVQNDNMGFPIVEEVGQEIGRQRDETFFERQFPSLVETTHSAQEAIKILNGVAPELRETLLEYRKSAGAISEAAGHFSSMIENIKKTLEIIPVAKPFLEKILDAITIAYDIIMACLNKIFYTVPTLIVRLFQLFGVDAMLINQFVKNVVHVSVSNETVQGPEAARAQGLAIFDILTEGIGTLIMGKPPDMAQMKYVNEALRYKQGIAREVKNLGELAMVFLHSVPEQVQIWLSYVIPTKWWLDIFAPGTKFYTWIDEVNSLDSHDYTVRAAFDHKIQQQVLNLYKTGQELLKECTSRGTKVAQIYKLLESSFKKIDALYKIVDMSAINRGGRRVPFVVYLYGESGQGKSFLMTVLPAILAGCPPDTPNLAWSRNPAVQHWDGYTGQFAVKYDDFGALIGSTNGPGDIGELMTIVSNEQMRLPMASLEDKGEVFRSQVVICSSNMAYLNANELRDPQALYRRRHAFYEVRVKKEFRKNGSLEVDPAKIPADYSHWEFTERHNFDQGWRGDTLNYQQFISEVKKKYVSHINQQYQAGLNYEAMIEAANMQPAKAEGLADEFSQFMNLNNTFAEGDRRKLFTQVEGARFYEALKKIDEEMEKPLWYKALCAILPLAGIVAGTIGMIYGIKRYVSNNKIDKVSKISKVENKQTMKDLGNMFNHPRIQKLVAEGRWDGLYSRLKNSTPEMVEIFSNAMDHCEDFANLTDEEVEAIVDSTLRDPRVKKFLAAEGVYSGHHLKTQQRMNQLKPIVRPPQPIKAEGCIDQNAMEVTNNKLVPHLGRINIEDYEMVCIMIGGRVVLSVYHIFCDRNGDKHKDGTVITIKIGTSIFRNAYNSKKLVRIGKDVVLYEMDACLPIYKDISKHFITNAGLENAIEFPALMATVDRTMIPIVYRIETKVKRNDLAFFYSANTEKETNFWNNPNARGEICENQNQDSDFVIAEATAWSYKTDTFPGMCGSAVVMLDKYAARKIVGIHSAGGSTGDGLAQIVTEEMINQGLRVLGFNLQPAYPKVDIHNTDLGCIQAQGNFTKLGTIFKHPRISEKTRIVPSITHGKIYPLRTSSAILNSMDPRAFRIGDTTPIRKGIEKYGNPAPIIDNEILDRVIECVSDIMKPLRGGVGCRVLNQFEALNGIKDDEYVARMDMLTSSGYPWNLMKGAKGKYPFIQRIPNSFDYEIVSDELQEKVLERMALARKGIRVPSLWIDTQKDERRDFIKVFEGKTRVFTIPPLDFTIVCRQLFGAFNSAFYKNRLSYFSAVGIDPASIEWSVLLNKMETNSTIGFGGDFSGWDGNLSPQFMMGVCEIINNWYDDEEENKTARRVLFDEMIHTPQCAGNEVYFTHIGNPSGNPLTVIINTIVHKMDFLYAYFKRVPSDLNSLKKFAENIVLFIYGDDGICSIKKSMLPYFNPQILFEEMKLLNLDYTNSKKDGPACIEPVRNLTFLKRGFREDDCGRIHAIMDIQTITELTNWTRECADLTIEQASIDNLNDSLSFMYSYGKDMFEKHRNKIKEKLPLQFHQELNDYAYYHKNFLSKYESGRYLPALAQGSVDPGMITDSNTPITTNINEPFKTSDNTKGIVIEAQRAIEVSGPTQEPMSGSGRLTRSCMPDPKWSLPDTVHRRVWVNTYQWTTARAMGDVICQFKLPQDIIVNYLQSMAFERFVFWKGSINLDFELTGMKMHLGRLKAYCVPFTDTSIVNPYWHTSNPQSYYGLNPISLDPTTSTKGRLVVPYYNPKSYISINGPAFDANIDFIGSAYVSVLVPLGAATGSPTSISLVVWASFGEDSEFYVPLNSSAVGTVYNQEHGKQLLRNAKLMPARAEGGTVSTTNNVTAYGNMDGTCIPQRMTNDDFQGAASGNQISVPAYDRAARSINPFNIVRKYIQNFSHSKGSEQTTRMDLDPSNLAIVLKDHFSTNIDEMKMDFLLHTPTYVDSITWAGTAGFGTSLYSGFIGPMSSCFQEGSVSQITFTVGLPVYMTQWEFNAMSFAFWRGGMRIRLELVATMFHTGRLCLTLNYGAPPGVQSTLRDATSQYAVEFELNSDKNVFEYDIPYIAETRWKRMCRGPFSTDDPESAGAWWNDYFLGSFDISVVTQLQTTSVAPSDATIIMSYSGSPDFEVYMPSNINQTFVPLIVVPNIVPLPAKAQGDNGGGVKAGVSTAPNPPDASADVVSASRIGPPGMGPMMSDDHFGINAPIRDIRHVMRRYYPIPSDSFYDYVAQSTVATADNDTQNGYTPLYNTGAIPANQTLPYCLYKVIPVAPNFSANNLVGSNLYAPDNSAMAITRMLSQFRFWRGSLRYKFIFGNIENGTTGDITPANSGVIYIPHGQFRYVTGNPFPNAARPNWAYICANLATAMIQGSGAGGDNLVPFPNFNAVNYAQDVVGHGIVNYSEIEIPFASIYNTLPTAQGTLAANFAPDLLTTGVLVTWSVFNYQYSATPGMTPFTRPLTILQSIGDDFRFGTYLGMPPVSVLAQTNGLSWPDTWIVNTPTSKDKVKEIKPVKQKSESDEDFDVLETNDMTKDQLVKKLTKLSMTPQNPRPAKAQGNWWSDEKDLNYWRSPHRLNKRNTEKRGPSMVGIENYSYIPYQTAENIERVMEYYESYILEPIIYLMKALNRVNLIQVKITRMSNYWILVKWWIPNSIIVGEFSVKQLDWEDIDNNLYFRIHCSCILAMAKFNEDHKYEYEYGEDVMRKAVSLSSLQTETSEKDKALLDYCLEAEENYYQSTPPIYPAQAQGDRGTVTSDGDPSLMKQPTVANIALIVLSVFNRIRTEENYNARMAMNEIVQNFDSCAYTWEEEPSRNGFVIKSKFLVDNPQFTNVTAVGMGPRKKIAEEKAAYGILSQLIDKIPSCQRENMEMHKVQNVSDDEEIPIQSEQKDNSTNLSENDVVFTQLKWESTIEELRNLTKELRVLDASARVKMVKKLQDIQCLVLEELME